MGLARHTVQRYLRAEGYPERSPRSPRTTLITPYEPYLRARWAAGCHNAAQLWREIRPQGFRGGHTTLKDYLRGWRPESAMPGHPQQPRVACPTTTNRRYGSRETCWLLLRAPETLTTHESSYLTRLYQTCPQVALAEALTEEFHTVVREHHVAGLDAWLRGAETSGIAEISAVARGMWLDRQAIEAAVTSKWSNGQVEGAVNRLKAIKRTMYGRAKLDLLKRRVLHRA
jgi:transposase